MILSMDVTHYGGVPDTNWLLHEMRLYESEPSITCQEYRRRNTSYDCTQKDDDSNED
jgi:hypothetical protein